MFSGDHGALFFPYSIELVNLKQTIRNMPLHAYGAGACSFDLMITLYDVLVSRYVYFSTSWYSGCCENHFWA